MSQSRSDFSHSLTDLMSGVAAVFLVIMAVFIQQATQRAEEAEVAQRAASVSAAKAREFQERMEQENAATRKVLRDLEQQLRRLLPDQDAVTLDGILLTVNLDPRHEFLSFDRGSETLDPERRARLVDAASPVFRSVCEVFRRPDDAARIDRIILEGHTDNSPVPCSSQVAEGCLFGENVSLSARRGVYVLRQIYEHTYRDADVRACIEERFLVSGRGPAEPASTTPGGRWRDPQTAAEAARNRRVVLKILGRIPEALTLSK